LSKTPRTHWQSKRAKVVHLLRNGTATVNELAATLNLTDNAVRSHLNYLEKHRLVRRRGWKKGVRRPHAVYELTPKADQLSSTAYDKVFSQLAAVLEEQLPAAKVRELFRDTGRSMVEHGTQGSPQERINDALKALRAFGGNVRAARSNGTFVLQSAACPLAAVVAEHPEVCQVIEGVLEKIVGGRVEQRCRYDPKPRCCFEIAAPGKPLRTKRSKRKPR
jgi:predicted ArsR family transcriptional regulator